MFKAYCTGQLYVASKLVSCQSNLRSSWGYKRLQKSKDSLKDCFENVNIRWCLLIIQWCLLLTSCLSSGTCLLLVQSLYVSLHGSCGQIAADPILSLRLIMKWAATWDFQQCGIFTSVDSDEPVQSPFKSRNSKWCSVSSLTVTE